MDHRAVIGSSCFLHSVQWCAGFGSSGRTAGCQKLWSAQCDPSSVISQIFSRVTAFMRCFIKDLYMDSDTEREQRKQPQKQQKWAKKEIRKPTESVGKGFYSMATEVETSSLICLRIKRALIDIRAMNDFTYLCCNLLD